MRRRLAFALLGLVALAACERAEVRVVPSEIAALEGVRTVVQVEAALGCDDPADPVVEPAGETAFTAEVHRYPGHDGSTYFIGNPGMGSDIYQPPGAGYPDPVTTEPGAGQVISTCGDRCATPDSTLFDVILTPPAGAGPGPHLLRLRVSGCGTEASADLTVAIVGSLDLGAFCGITTGATCAEDAGCERAGCGELCAAAGTRERTARRDRALGAAGFAGSQCLASACTDPVPSGATCGCVLGACSWRLP